MTTMNGNSFKLILSCFRVISVVEYLFWTILPWTIIASAMEMEMEQAFNSKIRYNARYVSILWLSICIKSAHCEGCNKNTPYQNYSHTPILLLSDFYNGSQWYGRIESFKITSKHCIHVVWINCVQMTLQKSVHANKLTWNVNCWWKLRIRDRV